MKFLLLLGALCGFTLAFVSAVLVGNDLLVGFRNGAFGAAAGALMMRGFASILSGTLRAQATQKAKEKANSQ